MKRDRDIPEEKLWLLERFWLLENYGSIYSADVPVERYMYDDNDQRYYHIGIDSDNYPLYWIEQLFAAVLAERKVGSNETSFRIIGRVLGHIFIEGLFALTENNDDELVGLARAVILRWRETGEMESIDKKSRWYSKLYPAVIRGKENVIHSLDDDLCEICNHKQWSVDRAIKEAFIYGVKKLRKQATANSKRKHSFPGRSRPCWIYGLVDPRDHNVHYIGKSVHPIVRWREHLADESDDSPKVKWLEELAMYKLEPDLRILEETTRHDDNYIERKWIEHGIEQGWPLTNRNLTNATP